MLGRSLPPYGAEQLVSVLREDGVAKAVVLSNAYFFGYGTDKQPRSYEKVMEVNNRVAEVVAEYPDLLVGFCSVNSLADTALQLKRNCTSQRPYDAYADSGALLFVSLLDYRLFVTRL